MNTNDSPAAEAIRRHLRRHRPRLPIELRFAFVGGLVLLVVYLSLLTYFFTNDRALFDDMVRLYGLTVLAGREPAMFAVYQPPTPVPLGWMAFFAVLDDVGTLLLTITWVWFAFERLHGVRWIGSWLVGLEKTALEHRHLVRRWGLGGLAAFYWLPGFGSGVLAICVIGVLARIPLGHLLPALVASAAAVALFWALVLHETSALLPSGPTEWLPATILAVVILAAVVAAVRRRRDAHILLLEWPPPTGAAADRFKELGIRAKGGIVEVDSHVLAEQLPSWKPSRGQGHALAELLLIEGMTLETARALEAAGVEGIPDLAILRPRLVDAALAEAKVIPEASADRMVEAASKAASTASAWRRR